MRAVDAHPELQRMLLTLRIVVIALAAGVALFLAFAAWHHYAGDGAAHKTGARILTWVAVGVAVMNVLVFGLVRMAVLRAARETFRRGEVQSCANKYQAATIVWCAGLEGAGLLAAVAFFLEGHVLSLALGGLMVFWILFSMPTRDKVDGALE